MPKNAPDRFGFRTVYTFAMLRMAADNAARAAEATESGSMYTSMLSRLATAFMLEAYLNHLGEERIPDWLAAEKDWLDPKSKLKLIIDELHIPFERGNKHQSDYLGYLETFEFRRKLVHARTERLTGAWSEADEGPAGSNALEADWEKLCTPERAREALAQAERIVRLFHSATGHLGDPLSTISEGGSSGHGGLA